MKFLLTFLFVLSVASVSIPTSVEARPPVKGDRGLTIFVCTEESAIKNLTANAVKGKDQFTRALKMYLQLGTCKGFPQMVEVHVEKKLMEGEISDGVVYAVQLQSTSPLYKYYTLFIYVGQGA